MNEVYHMVLSDETVAALAKVRAAFDEWRKTKEYELSQDRAAHIDDMEWKRATARWNRKHK